VADHVYLTCPNCGEPMREPFSRHSGPIPHIHHRRGKAIPGCRLIVTPDSTGHNHTVRVIPWGTRLEDALADALQQGRAA
jgi:hypothetical protein